MWKITYGRMQNYIYCILATIYNLSMDKFEEEYSKRNINYVLVSWSHFSVFFYDPNPLQI